MLPKPPTEDKTQNQQNQHDGDGSAGAGNGAGAAWSPHEEEGGSIAHKDTPFRHLHKTQKQQTRQRQNQLWPSLETKHTEEERQGDQTARNRFSHEQLKWLKDGLHTTMDDHFDKVSSQLSHLYHQQDAESFLQVWTDSFGGIFLKHTSTPAALQKSIRGGAKPT